ncbi:double-strand break repair protein AddB [Formicincola oecophyllae]|uniref:Double-strand break repair protein AddB n=1 Tax=Formicincola oecophyllae TaxID=2558361 RepID=A0A4Y6U8K0_9PROT|nr:double-strand break repair protein AddB [Formicincola oecophyllae]QDH13692.1 double-strand break repair protein AddB [Formicincola oecophyllae]
MTVAPQAATTGGVRLATGCLAANIPADVLFLDEVARRWCAACGQGTGGLSSGTILVPSKRTAMGLQQAFLRVLKGQCALLPAIIPLGMLDREPALAAMLDHDLPPAVTEEQRLAVLSSLIMASRSFHMTAEQAGEPPSLERVWPLARSLAELMDEAEREGVDLRKALPKAVEGDLAAHWQQTLSFLGIITEAWPAWLAEGGLGKVPMMNPVARRMVLLEAQAACWQANPPAEPLWAVGFTDATTGLVKLLAAIMAAPQGLVVMQGVDDELPPPLWKSLAPTHPQATLRKLLGKLGLRRGDLETWRPPAPAQQGAQKRPEGARRALWRHVMTPEQGLDAWRQSQPSELLQAGLEGLETLSAPTTQQEARAIALALRDAVQVEGRHAALITPDRDLAGRVTAELKRFGVRPRNSSGEPLLETPGAVFLRLVARTWESDFAPVTLLALLKHPFTALGFRRAEARALARQLERAVLRGPAPDGLKGIAQALGQRHNQKQERHRAGAMTAEAFGEELLQNKRLQAYVSALTAAFQPLLTLPALPGPVSVLGALARVADAMARLPEDQLDAPPAQSAQASERRLLWVGEDGQRLSDVLAQHMEAFEGAVGLPPLVVGGLEPFLVTMLAPVSVTGQRGYQEPGVVECPRIEILGLLEASTLSFDTVVLGGLNEGVWPPAAESGPWLSRPMRARAGLPLPEERIGTAARYFINAVLGNSQPRLEGRAGKVILARAARHGGTPCRPARWWARLEAFMNGQSHRLQAPAVHVGAQGDTPFQIPLVPAATALAWESRLDVPRNSPGPVKPPAPCPPVALRPRQLSVTEIDTLNCDPYAIYARHILKLRALPPLAQDADQADYGTLVHAALDNAFRAAPDGAPSASLLRHHFMEELARGAFRPSLRLWWKPRLLRIADWVAEQEAARLARLQPGHDPAHVWTELTGQWETTLPAGRFVLKGRADRIDVMVGVDRVPHCWIYDYKTGTPPSGAAVKAGWASQTVLEAAMVEAGAYQLGEVATPLVEGIVYWHLRGTTKDPGAIKIIAGSQPGLWGENGSGPKKTDELKQLVDGALDKVRTLMALYERPGFAYRSQPYSNHVPRYTDYALLARVPEWRSGSGLGGKVWK